MTDKKLITVVGATGAQGGATARALLKDETFAVRAVTRDPDSDAARALADAGAEVVRADIDDAASLLGALEGAYGAFFVTFFWAHFSPEVEQAQAQRMAQAA
ncbi:MAG: NmrA family NAD(P)-binding protein, partial [Jiangellales bacterium]